MKWTYVTCVPDTKLSAGFVTVGNPPNQSKAFIFDKLVGSASGK